MRGRTRIRFNFQLKVFILKKKRKYLCIAELSHTEELFLGDELHKQKGRTGTLFYQRGDILLLKFSVLSQKGQMLPKSYSVRDSSRSALFFNTGTLCLGCEISSNSGTWSGHIKRKQQHCTFVKRCSCRWCQDSLNFVSHRNSRCLC